MSPHLRNSSSPLAKCLSLELSSFLGPDRQRQGAGWSLWQGTITRKQEGELEGEEALQHCQGNCEKGGLVLGFLDIGWLNFLTLQMRTAEAWSRQGPTKTKCDVPGVLYQPHPWGRRGGSVTESCSFREPRFGFQHPHWEAHNCLLTPVLG